MGESTPFPSPAAIARAELLTRERFVYEGETLEDALAPGSARRRALDAALAEVEAGRDAPSIEWRRKFSLLLGLERLLSEEEPHLVDGTVLSAHQVDALSGTLTALLAEASATATERLPTAGAAAAAEQPARLRAPRLRLRRAARTTTSSTATSDEGEDERRGAAGLAGRRTSSTRTSSWRSSPRIPNAAAVLVRARHRRRQDGRRARVRRGVAHRRHPDPHPPPQPRRPVPRRAARPRLSRPDPRAAARRPRRRQRPGHGRDLPVVRAQRRPDLRRVRDRDLRRGAHRARREDLGGDPPLGRTRSSSA